MRFLIVDRKCAHLRTFREVSASVLMSQRLIWSVANLAETASALVWLCEKTKGRSRTQERLVCLCSVRRLRLLFSTKCRCSAASTSYLAFCRRDTTCRLLNPIQANGERTRSACSCRVEARRRRSDGCEHSNFKQGGQGDVSRWSR